MEAIKHELNVKASPQEAYNAAATDAGIKSWWAKDSEVGERSGAPVVLRFNKPDMSAVMKFDVTSLEPGRRVQWRSTENTNPIWPGSTLTWEVEPAASGSVVRFTHEGFSGGGQPYEMTVAGWQVFMDSLKAYLDGGSPTPSD